MTGSRGSLGPRLLSAFGAVALISVLLLTAAALIGTDRGVNAAQSADRRQTAERAATMVAQAYQHSGGWQGIDVAGARAVADAAGAQLVVRDASMAMMWPGHAPASAGPGMRDESAADTESAAVLVDGQQVGTVVLVFGRSSTGTGRTVAWLWVAGAAAVALLVAFLIGLIVARRLSRPIRSVADAARAFTRGDRGARSPAGAPGELGELADAVNSMADQVVRAEQTRRRLAADVAHELRTPLAALQAGLEELRDGLADPGPQRIAALHDQALRVGRVVDDLAQLSAAEAAALTLHLDNADLTVIAAAAIAAQAPALRAAGLILVSSLVRPVPVRADPDRLHQAITNLLANAARYCRPGDTVTVHAYVADNEAIIEVSDTGPGIEPTDLPHLFERLWRGSAGVAVSGSGIGLAVVRELVNAHAGAVDVRSEPGHGATFIIRLPLAASAPDAVRTSTPGP